MVPVFEEVLPLTLANLLLLNLFACLCTMHMALSGPSFVAKLQTNVKIKILKKNSVIYSLFFLDKFFKFKNENYNHIFTWILGGGVGG
jgi:hypothetical protein